MRVWKDMALSTQNGLSLLFIIAYVLVTAYITLVAGDKLGL